jgi:two-component system LytT family sensor kinase
LLLLKKHTVLLYHIYFWVAFTALNIILRFSRNPNYVANVWENLLTDILILNIPTLYGFYISWYAYSKFLEPIKVTKLIVSIILIFITYTIVWYVVDYRILPQLGKDYTPTSEFIFWQFIAVIFYIFIECNIVAFGFQYFKKTLMHQKRLRQIQNEKLEIEYAFLRAQINPHFLNNTLNFFYAKSLPLSEELSNGIMTLSEIMRYSLQIDQNNQLMPLMDEIEHARNIIDINKLRFNNRLCIDLKIEGDAQNATIVPLTLVTLLENILKHGDCINQGAGALISLKIEEDKTLIIKTFNKKYSKQNKSSNGTSLENLQKRLKSYYGAYFKLSINDQDDFYALSLTLPNKYKTR